MLIHRPRSVATVVLVLICGGQALGDEPQPRPNVLFLFTDDQRADAVGALGNTRVHTPNLDRLVGRGLVFENAYILGGNMPAVCLPSRNMVLSGRAFTRYERYASADEPNFPTTLSSAGYETYHHGKRGNTAPEIEAAFKTNKYLDDERDRTSGQPGRQVADEAISFLRKHESERPFFMYLAFANPHDPRVAADTYREYYDPEMIPLPTNFLPFHPFDNGELKVRDERLAPWPRTDVEIRRQLHDYYATITALDHQIGRILDSLDELGLTENTIVIFASDNGLALGSHGLMGKQSLYEHSIRVPLVLAGPGIRSGRTEVFAYLLDLFPTVCELVGAPVAPGLDGVSLVPTIQGESAGREAIFAAYRDVQRSIRIGPYKLIRYPRIDRTQLFHLADDPHELNDLATDPSQAGPIAKLLDRLTEEQARFGDSLPLITDDPAPGDVDLSFFRD